MENKGKCPLFMYMAILCVGASIFFGGQAYITYRGYAKGEAGFDQVRAVYKLALGNQDNKKAAYKRLKENNGDFTGWIQIKDTFIDYPVMQTPQEPDYYLNHGFDRERSLYGSIYIDAACRMDGSCRNIILYGHHMRNGAMFGSLERYSSKEYCKTHSRIMFGAVIAHEAMGEDGETGDSYQEGEYEVIAVFRSSAKELKDIQSCLAAETKEDYEAFLSYCKNHSLYDTGLTSCWPEQLLTLATCEYTQKNGRLFVVAKRVVPEYVEEGFQ